MEKLKRRFNNNIKGAIAETLIKELFIENDYVVFDYGVEHLVPNFSSRIKALNLNNNCENSKVIKSLPDLLITKNGKADYIEVKFRSGEFFQPPIDYKFQTAFIINVKKDGIYIAKACDLIDNGEYSKIIEHNIFNLSEESINAAEEVVRTYFTGNKF